MANIKIKPEELRISASEMEGSIVKAEEALKKSSNVMGRTGESFDSAAGNELRRKFEELKGKFPAFSNEMRNYVVFLRKTADEYERMDQEIQKIANEHLES